MGRLFTTEAKMLPQFLDESNPHFGKDKIECFNALIWTLYCSRQSKKTFLLFFIMFPSEYTLEYFSCALAFNFLFFRWISDIDCWTRIRWFYSFPKDSVTFDSASFSEKYFCSISISLEKVLLLTWNESSCEEYRS